MMFEGYSAEQQSQSLTARADPYTFSMRPVVTFYNISHKCINTSGCLTQKQMGKKCNIATCHNFD